MKSQSIFFTSLRVMFLMAIVVSLSFGHLSEARDTRHTSELSYDEYFDMNVRREVGGGYVWTQDENRYVYTSAYQKRYSGMPKRWIDDELKGAYALAWRYEEDDVWQCGYGGDAAACKRVSNCRIELYVEDSQFPQWQDDSLFETNLFREKSSRFLIPQSKADRTARQDLMDKIHGVLGRVEYHFTDNQGKRQQLVGYVAAYDREEDVGVSNATLDVSCSLALEADSEKAVEIHLFSDSDPYVVVVPSSYISRIKAYQQQKPQEAKAFDEGKILSGNYVKWFTKAGWDTRDKQGYYLIDPNIWNYTQVFAKRFGMPLQWVSDELQDAQAMAFRITKDYSPQCGYGGDANACSALAYEILDIYIASQSTIPWNAHYSNFGFKHSDQPLRHQSGRDKKVTERKPYERKIPYRQESEEHMGLGYKLSQIVEYKRFFKTKRINSGHGPIYYRRQDYPGMDYFGMSLFLFHHKREGKNFLFEMADSNSIYYEPNRKVFYTYSVPAVFWERMYAQQALRQDEIDGVWNIVTKQLNLGKDKK